MFPGGHANLRNDFNGVRIGLDLGHLIGDDRAVPVRVTAVGDRVEFVIDGRRVFYGPLPEPLADEAGRKLMMHLGWTGMAGEAADVRWRTADARKP